MYVAAYVESRVERIAAFGSELGVAEGLESAEEVVGPRDPAYGVALLQAVSTSNEHKPTQRVRDDPREAGRHAGRCSDRRPSGAYRRLLEPSARSFHRHFLGILTKVKNRDLSDSTPMGDLDHCPDAVYRLPPRCRVLSHPGHNIASCLPASRSAFIQPSRRWRSDTAPPVSRRDDCSLQVFLSHSREDRTYVALVRRHIAASAGSRTCPS